MSSASAPRSPLEILAAATTLPEALERLVELQPESEALVLARRGQEPEVVTLAALWARARAYQASFVGRGLQPGDAVVLILPTGTELIEAYFGAMLAGGIPALLSTPARRIADPAVFTGRVAHVVSNSSPNSIVCEPDVAALFGEGAPALGATQILTPGQIDEGEPPTDRHHARPGDLATMQYSSGTTGTPKGVLLTHGAIMNHLRAMKEAFSLTPEDVGVNWIPLFHDMGLFGAFLLPLLTGCRTVLIPTEDFMRDPGLWLRAIHEHRGTFSWAPNLAYALCAKRLDDRDLEGLDLSSWRLALNGSEPVMQSTVDAFAERMAPRGFRPEAMCPAWGLAETTALGSLSPPDEEPRCEVIDRGVLVSEERAEPTDRDGVHTVSVGPAIPDCELEIRDASGSVLADRCVGDLWLRSSYLFSGYHNDPERSAASLVDGWLRTGDRGYMVDGHLYFVAREKDLIIVGGEKYVPDDLEAMINRVPGVRVGCAVVFGVLSEERGTEELAAVVETRETDPEALATLDRAIREEIVASAGLGLRYLLLTPPDGVEKTTGGKLSRSRTRERYLDEMRGGA